MAVRPIDGDALRKELTCNFAGEPFHGNRKVTIGEVRRIIESMPTLTPPNEWVTLDQLREMDGEPVWVELYRAWALVEVKQNGSIMFYGNSFSCPYSRTWKVYRFRPDRRPPEGEEDTK